MNDRFLAVRSRLWILALCVFITFCSLALQAQSVSASYFLFPHYVSNQVVVTGVTVFNPNSQAATVTFAFRDQEGQLLAGVADPVTQTVPARGLLNVTAVDLFGAGLALNGSLEVSSPTAGIIAHALTYDSYMTFLESLNAAETSLSAIFPVIPGSAEGIAEIDLANPNPRETSVELKLWGLDGRLLGLATVPVPAGGSYHGSVQDTFPSGTSFGNASHITAVPKVRNVLSAPQSVAGTCLFMGFTSAASAGSYADVAALNAVPVTQTANAGVIPYFHTGGLYASILGLVNVESTAVSVTVTAIANNGSTIGKRVVSLAPQGGVRAPLQSVISELGTSEQEGWLLIQSSGRTIGNIIYGRSDGAALAAAPIQRVPSAGFLFSELFQGNGLNSSISLVNLAADTSTADVRVIGADGSTLAASQIALDPNRRVSTSLGQLFPELGESWSFTVHVTSNGALFATATIWRDAADMAANVAPQNTGFMDSPLTSFTIAGNVTVNNLPAAGYKVGLTGTATKSSTTDKDGNYFFNNLPRGSYTVAVIQAGFQFVPAEASIELTNTSRSQNFQAFTAPDAIVVQPDSFPVGSPDTRIIIYGKDFNPTSEAFVGALRLSTTYVDTTQLQAIVPAFLTAAASRFHIVVVTNGTDTSRRVSQPYSAVAYQDKPSLAALDTGGDIVEGSPAGSLLLKGIGFLEGARVLVNGSSAGIQVNVISSQLIVAYLPSSYFEFGGIYPVEVENPFPAGARSAVRLLTVYNPPPGVQAVLPGVCSVRLEMDASPLSIEVTGYGFRRGAVVMLEGQPLITTYCETDEYCLDTHLFAKVPALMLRKAGFGKIEVKNPEPALASLESVYLRIEGLQPTITWVQSGSPTLAPSSYDFTMPLVVNGTNFGPETEVFIGQSGVGENPKGEKPDVLSTTQLLSSFKISYPMGLGEWYVFACNLPPGGGCTDPVTFMITEGSFAVAPFLTSLNPGTVTPGGRSFTLTVNGYNFKPGAVVNFRTTALVTTAVSNYQLKAVVPASLIRTGGKIPISVTSPGNAGASNRLFLDIK